MKNNKQSTDQKVEFKRAIQYIIKNESTPCVVFTFSKNKCEKFA